MEALNNALFLALNASAAAPPAIVAMALFLARWPVGIALLLVFVAVVQQPTGKLALLVRLLLTVLVAMAISYFIRSHWYHPRPFVVGLGHTLLVHEPTASFPSFHATFLFSLGLGLLKSGISWVLILVVLSLGCLTAWARVYLGVHYPLDILAGFVVSGLAAFMVSRLPMHKINYRK